MQGIDVFLNTYVRLDEGTAALVCAHRSAARTAAWLYAALVQRGAAADAFCFDVSDEETEALISAKIAELRAASGVRRVAVIVCEPEGPSFCRAIAAAQGDKPEKTPVFRIYGRSTGVFDLLAPSARQRRGLGDAIPSPEAVLDDTTDEGPEGLSQSEIDDLLAYCDTELADLDDREIEELAQMAIERGAEEIGSLSDEELSALAELEDSELLELASTWGEEGFRVLA